MCYKFKTLSMAYKVLSYLFHRSLTLLLIPFLPSLLHSSQPASFYLKHIKNVSASVRSFSPTPGTLLPRTFQESFQFVHIIWNTAQKYHLFQEVSLKPLSTHQANWEVLSYCSSNIPCSFLFAIISHLYTCPLIYLSPHWAVSSLKARIVSHSSLGLSGLE